MLEVDKQISNYILKEKLGSGGFGEVWRAERHTQLSVSSFALKFFRPNDEDRISLEKEKREIGIWQKVSGLPNIISVIEADIFQDYIYIVSEFADGGSLEKHLLKNGGKASSIDRAVKIVLEILTGLDSLHRMGFVHRDIKPANILIRRDVHCLADFGISREMKTYSKTAQTAGTYEYMPPEAFEKKPSVTLHTDIWAVGVILQKLLTGEVPFPEDNIPSLIYSILHEEPEEMPSDIPEGLHEIVKKALRKDRFERYNSALEMIEELKQYSISLSAPIKPKTQQETLLLKNDETLVLEQPHPIDLKNGKTSDSEKDESLANDESINKDEPLLPGNPNTFGLNSGKTPGYKEEETLVLENAVVFIPKKEASAVLESSKDSVAKKEESSVLENSKNIIPENEEVPVLEIADDPLSRNEDIVPKNDETLVLKTPEAPGLENNEAAVSESSEIAKSRDSIQTIVNPIINRDSETQQNKSVTAKGLAEINGVAENNSRQNQERKKAFGIGVGGIGVVAAIIIGAFILGGVFFSQKGNSRNRNSNDSTANINKGIDKNSNTGAVAITNTGNNSSSGTPEETVDPIFTPTVSPSSATGKPRPTPLQKTEPAHSPTDVKPTPPPVKQGSPAKTPAKKDPNCIFNGDC